MENHRNFVKTKDKSIQSDEDLIKLDDDQIRKIESYEKYIEQKHSSSISGNNNNVNNVNNCINNNNQQPVSILKQPKINTNSTGTTQSSATSSIATTNNLININNKRKSNLQQSCKPNTIMSLEDRDIVVIDKADIKESTKNKNSIIVFENLTKELDLADLLGSNWPKTAGDAVVALNTATTQSDAKNISGGNITTNNQFTNRNKSPNILSHFNNRTDRKIKETVNKLVQQQQPQQQQKNDLSMSYMGTTTNNDILNKRDKKAKNVESFYDNIVSGKRQHLMSSEQVGDEDLRYKSQSIESSPLNEIPGMTEMGVGSMVEVTIDDCENLCGVIRWIGYPFESSDLIVGVELEDDHIDLTLNITDGTYNGKRLFKCPDKRAIFVDPKQCSVDRRFTDENASAQKIISDTGGATNHKTTSGATENQISSVKLSNDTKLFGQVECPPVIGSVPPIKMFSVSKLEEICGKFKGIQGHHNSCYLDATLFAMFTFTSVFDSLLFRPAEKEDIKHYEEVQKVLREDIVNPLRKNVFVRADRVMKLRHLLDELSSVSGLTCEEKDPEEFLNSLLAQIMRAEPFLKLSSGQDTFFYQLFVEKDERLSFPSVQQLFEQSFLASDIKLKEVPSCLIIQMPRFGKNFKMYSRILPTQVLDVTDVIEDSPRQCTVCGKLADYECRECFGIMQSGVGLECTGFCKKCFETAHSHTKRSNHTPKEISVPEDFKIMTESLAVPRLFMELFAVVCIETSHYVAFVKTGSGLDAPWCFFDSMADRKGEQNGYNIPELVTVPDLPQWLSEDGARTIHEAAANDKMLPEHAKRLLCDGYMCMYQSTDVMMYR